MWHGILPLSDFLIPSFRYRRHSPLSALLSLWRYSSSLSYTQYYVTASCLSWFTPWEKNPFCSTYWIGGWVCPAADLDGVERRKIDTFAGNRTQILGHLVRSLTTVLAEPLDFFM
jgi:hypothetical protein